MNILLQHIEDWELSQKKLLDRAGLEIQINDEFDNEIGSRHIEITGNVLDARAVLWEDGFLELTALDENTNEFVINTSCSVSEIYELEEQLNTWLNEIVIY
ncbi:MAG: hypothetical protein COA44_12320 [Arcobacter sp.]|nr:MAG: hypothetical protein COA44_12320 [Arcobacter sp.]